MLKKIITVGSLIAIITMASVGCGSKDSAEKNTVPAESAETVSETENKTVKTEEIETEPVAETDKEEPVNDETWEYGTTNGNAKNYSMFERRGNILYFINYSSNGSLCKLDISGEGETSWNRTFTPQVLSTGGANEINVVGDKLYYVSNYNDNTKCEIFSMNTDGTDLKSLYKAPIKNMIVVNDWVYFLNENNYIEKMNINGEMHSVLLEKECYYLNVYQDKLIFRLNDDNGSIYSMNIDGSELTKLNDEASYEVMCDNSTGDIYYTTTSEDTLEYTDRICKMKVDGTQQEVFREGSFTSLNIHNGNIIAYERGIQTGFSVILSESKECGAIDIITGTTLTEEKLPAMATNVRQLCISEDTLSCFFDLSFSKDEEVIDAGNSARMCTISKDSMSYTLESSYDFNMATNN